MDFDSRSFLALQVRDPQVGLRGSNRSLERLEVPGERKQISNPEAEILMLGISLWTLR